MSDWSVVKNGYDQPVAATDVLFQLSTDGNSAASFCSAAVEYHQCHRNPRHFMTFRRKLFVRAAIGPAMPIATAMLLVASHISHPIPEPALALKRATIASERTDCLSFGFRSIQFVLSLC